MDDNPNPIVKTMNPRIYNLFLPTMSPMVPRGNARLELTSRYATVTHRTVEGVVLNASVNTGYARLTMLPSRVLVRTPSPTVANASHLYIWSSTFINIFVVVLYKPVSLVLVLF